MPKDCEKNRTDRMTKLINNNSYICPKFLQLLEEKFALTIKLYHSSLEIYCNYEIYCKLQILQIFRTSNSNHNWFHNCTTLRLFIYLK